MISPRKQAVDSLTRSSAVWAVALLLILGEIHSAEGQGIDVTDPLLWRYRATLMSLSEGTAYPMFLPYQHRAPTPGSSPQVLPFSILATQNTGFPESLNDQALWAGRGASVRIDGGLALAVGPVFLRVAPTFVYAANRPFEIVPAQISSLSEFADPWNLGRIDLPQRFGPEALAEWYWGQSVVGVRRWGLSLTYGTENQWWGPARYNPLLMSTNASGFPHLSLRTEGGYRVPGGRLGFSMIWGTLRESKWYDADPRNDRRFLTGMVVSWDTTLIPGLSLGAGRVHYRYYPEGGLRLGDYLDFFEDLFKQGLVSEDSSTGNDTADQMLSLFARWVLPDSGLELYLEWGRNDHSWDLRDFLIQPDHSRAYTVGLQKLQGDTDDGHLFGLEATQLGGSTTFTVRAEPTWYAHHIVRQGYTHLGQVIGAGIGPGSESQVAEYHRLIGERAFGLRLMRTRWYNDALFRRVAPPDKWRLADVSYRLSIDALVVAGEYQLLPEISFTYRFNRDFVQDRDNRNIGLRILIRRRAGPSDRGAGLSP